MSDFFDIKGEGAFPRVRLRRNRKAAWSRCLVAENILCAQDLILPLFVRSTCVPRVINSMPDVFRHLVEDLPQVCEEVVALGIPAVCLFPVLPLSARCEKGRAILDPEGILIQAIQKIKSTFPDLGIMTDVALDAFTSHGQDGLIQNKNIMNDTTLDLMAKAAVLQAQAGTDVIAPSDMMDGRVAFLRHNLDREGYAHVQIMPYTAKYASSFYRPFREGLGSASCLGPADKKTYQMDPANRTEALREGFLDIQEGADMLLVKPAGIYLDVILLLKQSFPLPIVAYHVSGEYAMLKAAAQKGWLDYEASLLEVLLSIKRAGACAIVTNAACEAARLLNQL